MQTPETGHPKTATKGKIVTLICLCGIVALIITGIYMREHNDKDSFVSKNMSIIASMNPFSVKPALTKNQQNTTPKSNELEATIKDTLGNDADHYGVYVSIPDTDFAITVNSAKVFYPGSISKLPIAVLIMKDIDSGKYTLDQNFPILESNKAYDTDELYGYENGNQLSLQDYLSYLISKSDNTAMMTLENILGGSQVVNNRTQKELGLTTLFRDPHEGTAQDVGKLLEGVYHQSYLKKETNDILINDMTNIAPWLQDRIPAGVPSGIKVAHKVGEIITDGGVTYADAGIIYGQKFDCVLVVMNQDVDQAEATSKIVTITQKLYQYLNE